MKNSELLLHQLFQTVRIISKGVNKRLESHGIYHSEWSIIVTLYERGSMTQGALAVYLNIEPPAVSKSLVKLEQKGFIIRIAGDDRREKKVTLTEKAVEQYSTWSEIIGQHRNSILTNLSEENQQQLTMLLQIIFQNAQQYERDVTI